MQQISLQLANHLIDAVLQAARSRSMPPIAVAVLDAGAYLKAFQREDHVSFLRADIAQAKAWGALALASDSNVIADRYQQDELQRGFINALNSMTGGKLIPLPGGVLLRNAEKEIIGAVGAAGGQSNEDEACVIEAIEILGLNR